MDNTQNLTLELDLEGGKRIKVQVTSYHLTLSAKLHIGGGGKIFKLGTFKINSAQYREWKDVTKIKYRIGVCAVLRDHPPKETPRTITFRIRQDFS
ncbi:hypothetical protein [Pseudomonas sp. LB1P83]